MEEMWTEKYRPRTLKEMIDQEGIIERLMEFAKERNMPHCLFAGPAGTGKTAAALALAHDLLGETWMENVLELNASDERGIDVVREIIKDFARTRPLGDAPFKILILDESDAMTSDAQHALRRTMEKYTRTCRFILICNYSSRLIEPIQSRCAVFRFRPLPEEAIRGRLRYIAQNEGIEVSDTALDAILYVAEGDMRRAINILQASASIGNKKIEAEDVYTITGMISPKEVREMLDYALNGKFMEARSRLYDLMIKYGVSGTDIVYQLHRELLKMNIEDDKRMRLIKILGDVDFRIAEGAHEDIQLSLFLAECALVGGE